MITTKDFKIKQTKCGYYSVYRIGDEKTFCLRIFRDKKRAISYIDWLIKYINKHYPEETLSV